MPFPRRWLPDPFVAALLATVVLASVLPVHGRPAAVLEVVSQVFIGLLFFLHGARLSREAVIAGMTDWRLQLAVLTTTFVLFPLLGLGLAPILRPLVTPELYLGVLFLCALPSTVQSSIAFTALARGNVAASVCAASASNLVGVVATPLLVGLLVTVGETRHVIAGSGIRDIALLLFAPFVAGQLARPVLAAWTQRHRTALRLVDQGSVLLVVYSAFSEAVAAGLWRELELRVLLGLAAIAGVLLTIVVLATTLEARVLGLAPPERTSLVFCGSKKSLATGVPMARVLFGDTAIGAIVLPIMLYHQLQLIVCAVLARRYAAATEPNVAMDDRPHA